MAVDSSTFQPILRFVTIHQGKINLLVVILLCLYLLAFFAEITWKLIPQPSTQSVANSTPSSMANLNTPENAQLNIAKLKSLNLFGDFNALPTVREEITDAPETRLNLVLTGVVSSNVQDNGAAIIAYQNVQNTYGIGDKIEGTQVTLDEIYIDRVIIRNRATRETLMLDGIDFNDANRTRANNQSSDEAEYNEEPGELSMPAEQIVNLRAKLAKEPASFTDFISFKPHAPQGEMVGYKISPGSDAALFNAVGLKPGDVVTSINGLDLSDIQQSVEAINQLRSAEILQLELDRNGEIMSFDIEIPASDTNY